MNTQTSNQSTTRTHSTANGRLKAAGSDSVEVDRDKAIKQFKEEDVMQTITAKSEEAISWAKNNPMKAMALGAMSLYFLGGKRIGRLTKLGLTSGLFGLAYKYFSKDKELI